MDLIIFLIALSLGSGAALLAYRIGGRSWTIKFAIRGPILPNSEQGILGTGKRDRASGFKPLSGLYGEISIQVLILLMTLFVSFVTPNTSAYILYQKYPMRVLGLLAIVTLIVIAYEIYIAHQANKAAQISKAKRDKTHEFWKGPIFAKKLIRGYIPYTLYSIISFFAIIMVVMLITDQTLIYFSQYKQAEAELDVLIIQTTNDLLDPGSQMVLFEKIYIKVLEGASFMVEQINTLILLIFAVFVLQFTVKHTPLSQAFEADALFLFDVLLGLSVGFIILYASFVHFFVYEAFFEGALLAMDKSRDAIAQGGWEMLGTFNTHYLDLIQRQGLTGFLLSLTNDRGGLLLALGAAGWVFDKRKKTDAPNS